MSMQLATEINIVVLLVGYVFSLTSIFFPSARAAKLAARSSIISLDASSQAAHNLELRAIHNHLGRLGIIPCVSAAIPSFAIKFWGTGRTYGY